MSSYSYLFAVSIRWLLVGAAGGVVFLVAGCGWMLDPGGDADGGVTKPTAELQVLAGDLTGDSSVTQADVQAFQDAAANTAGFMGAQRGDAAFRSEADLDNDGRITWQDFQLLLQAAGVTG